MKRSPTDVDGQQDSSGSSVNARVWARLALLAFLLVLIIPWMYLTTVEALFTEEVRVGVAFGWLGLVFVSWGVPAIRRTQWLRWAHLATADNLLASWTVDARTYQRFLEFHRGTVSAWDRLGSPHPVSANASGHVRVEVFRQVIKMGDFTLSWRGSWYDIQPNFSFVYHAEVKEEPLRMEMVVMESHQGPARGRFRVVPAPLLVPVPEKARTQAMAAVDAICPSSVQRGAQPAPRPNRLHVEVAELARALGADFLVRKEDEDDVLDVCDRDGNSIALIEADCGRMTISVGILFEAEDRTLFTEAVKAAARVRLIKDMGPLLEKRSFQFQPDDHIDNMYEDEECTRLSGFCFTVVAQKVCPALEDMVSDLKAFHGQEWVMELDAAALRDESNPRF